MPNVLTEQEYGILSPAMLEGVREDFPHVLLPQAVHPDSQNVFVRDGEVHRMRGRLKEMLDALNVKVQTPDAQYIRKYHTHVNTNAEYSVFCATLRHVYLWSTATKTWDLRYTASADVDHWSFTSFNGQVIMANWIDYVQHWHDTTTAVNFAPFDSASGLLIGTGLYCTRAKYVTNYENRLIIGYLQEGGNTYPCRIRWSSLGDEEDFNEAGAGDTGSKDFLGDDFLKGFGVYGTQFKYLIVFKGASYYRGWSVTSDVVIQWATQAGNVGLLATDSIVYDRQDRMYFLASDRTIRELSRGNISAAVQPTLRELNPTYESYACATMIDEYGLLWWSVPIGSGATGNNKIISYDPERNIFTKMDFAISAFGSWVRQTVWTIDTWPYDTIDTISQPTIDSVENVAGWPLDLAGDYSGYTYDLHSADTDMTAAYTSFIVLTTDFSKGAGLRWFKRIVKLQFYFRSEGTGTALIEGKRDSEYNFQTIGTIDLTDADSTAIVRRNIGWSKRARDFQFKISATNHFRFMGVIIVYEPEAGDR